MQGTRVRPLVHEDSTCCQATKPLLSCDVQLLSPRAATEALEPTLHNKRSYHNEKLLHRNRSSPCLPQLGEAHAQPQRASTAKINISINFLNMANQADHSDLFFSLTLWDRVYLIILPLVK